jgi:hypothetical protein
MDTDEEREEKQGKRTVRLCEKSLTEIGIKQPKVE